jgi:hypothetical protein
VTPAPTVHSVAKSRGRYFALGRLKESGNGSGYSDENYRDETRKNQDGEPQRRIVMKLGAEIAHHETHGFITFVFWTRFPFVLDSDQFVVR